MVFTGRSRDPARLKRYCPARGNRAIAASEAAATKMNWAVAAADARTAIDWAPWSSSAWQQLGGIQIEQHKLAAARMSLRQALRKDPADWNSWFALATVSKGTERSHALAEARMLNPLDPGVAALQPQGRGG